MFAVTAKRRETRDDMVAGLHGAYFAADLFHDASGLVSENGR
jgi:hypothetical protein